MSFASKVDAQAQADTWRAEFDDGGKLAFFTNDERLDAANALKQYRDAKVNDTLSAAVHYYLERRYPLGGDVKLAMAVEEFIKEKEQNTKVSQFYLWSLNRLRRLSENEKLAERRLSTLTAREILDHIYTSTSKKDKTKRWGAETQRQHFRYYKMFFGWCVENKFMMENPLARKNVTAPEGKSGEPLVLYLDTTQKLMGHASVGSRKDGLERFSEHDTRWDHGRVDGTFPTRPDLSGISLFDVLPRCGAGSMGSQPRWCADGVWWT